MRFVGIIVFVALISFLFSQTSYGSKVIEGCELLDIKPGCDISGWMHIVLGDVAISAVLALFLHYIAIKHGAKIEKIIKDDREMRERRKSYAMISLKNRLAALGYRLDILSIIVNKYTKTKDQSKALHKIDENRIEIKNIIKTIDYVFLSSNDVLEPELIGEIKELIIQIKRYIPQTDATTLKFEKYAELKEEILDMTKELSKATSSKIS